MYEDVFEELNKVLTFILKILVIDFIDALFVEILTMRKRDICMCLKLNQYIDVPDVVNRGILVSY